MVYLRTDFSKNFLRVPKAGKSVPGAVETGSLKAEGHHPVATAPGTDLMLLLGEFYSNTLRSCRCSLIALGDGVKNGLDLEGRKVRPCLQKKRDDAGNVRRGETVSGHLPPSAAGPRGFNLNSRSHEFDYLTVLKTKVEWIAAGPFDHGDQRRRMD